MVEVIKVIDFTDVFVRMKEILYIKVFNCSAADKVELFQIAETFKAKVIDYGKDSLLLEFVQTATKNDAVVKLMKEEFGKIEVVRGGSVGIESINVMERIKRGRFCVNEKSITTISLKKINKKSVYQYIYEHRQTAKLLIVQDLTMGLSTVSQNLNVLEKEGLISRDGFFESTGGRKAQVIQIVPEYRIAVGVGILKNMFHLAAVNLYGEAIAEETVAVPFAQSDAYYDGIASSLESFLDRNGYDREKILGVSIATQGIPAPDGESVLYGEILHNTDMKLADFSTRIPYPCRLEHDSKAAASLELWNHPEIESAVVFLLNRNLGGAVITNHKVHQGLSMHSGTLEHICIDPEGPECYCGQKGCLETYCSANALEAAAQMPVKEFFPALRAGNDARLTEIWDAYLSHLAYAMKTANLLLDGAVIVSGYLAPYFKEEDCRTLLEKVDAASPFPLVREQLLVGTHGQYTPAIGAALLFIEEFLQSEF